MDDISLVSFSLYLTILYGTTWYTLVRNACIKNVYWTLLDRIFITQVLLLSYILAKLKHLKFYNLNLEPTFLKSFSLIDLSLSLNIM